MADYRGRINELDNKIIDTSDVNQKLMYIDENIELNRSYVHALHRAIPVKIVFSVLVWPLILIFVPQIIIRCTKANICKKRIKSLEEERKKLRNNLELQETGKSVA